MKAVPALAVIARKMAQRPGWAFGTACPVAPDLYESGEQEMREILKRRGFSMCADANLSREGVRHFLLFGTPIVIHG
jgi:hypothetical protein